VLDLGVELLRQTKDIFGEWKKHFEDLLNLASLSFFEKVESEDLGEDSCITLSEVTRVVKKIPDGKVPGMDEIRPEMLKPLAMVALSWLTCLFNVACKSGSTPVKWQTGVLV